MSVIAFAGLDIAGSADGDLPALAVLLPDGTRHGTPVPSWRLAFAETAPPGTPYGITAAWARHVAGEIADAGAHVLLAADATGVGRPVLEMLRAQGGHERVEIVGITAHGGHNITGTWPDPHVPKQALVDELLVAVEQQALHVPGPVAGPVAAQMLAYREHITRTGRRTFAAPGKGRDDLISALQLAAWAGAHWHRAAGRLART